MEQLAEAGHAYLTEHTAKLVAGYFRLRDLGPLAVKGAAQPLRVFDLESPGAIATRLDASRARGFTRFVGRAAETAVLERAFEQAVAGDAQIVGVVGEPGVGKSRLCLEMVQRCRARGVPVHEAHCLSHGRALPFLPILQLFRSYFDIDERDDPAAARRKIAGTLVLLDDRFREALPLVFDFLGVPDPERPLARMDPDARQRQLVALVSEVTRARSAREPAVLLIDDLHWIDAASDALLGRILDAVRGTRTLVLVNLRPEYDADWMRRADYHRIGLQPLGREAIEELLAALLGHDRSLGPVRARIAERAGGNPFFVEELVQTLVEGAQLVGTPGAYRWAGGAEDPAIPATVQGVLAARIDRLPEAAKVVLQTAAVIGREFTEPVLGRVVDRSTDALAGDLATLTGAELILEQALYPEAAYAFKHPLTHEVAYRSQLAERRRRLHARVAEALTNSDSGSQPEHFALLAHHWEQAGDALQALRWHARAGEWLGAREPLEAIRHWQAVRRLLSEASESPETVSLGTAACLWVLNLEWRVGLPEEEIAEVFAHGKALAERSGDLITRARLLYAYGSAIGIGPGRYREALAHLEEALALVENAGDLEHRVVLHQRLSYLHSLTGNPAETLVMTERGLALAKGDIELGAEWVGYSPCLLMLGMRARSLMLTGNLAEASSISERALRLAIESNDLNAIVGSCTFASDAAVRLGDTEQALRFATRAIEAGERIGGVFFRVMSNCALAEALVEAGAWNEAMAAAQIGLEVAKRPVDAELRLVAALARANLGAGHHDRARAAATEALALYERFPDSRFAGVIACVTAAHVLLRTGGASPEPIRALELAESLAAAIPDRFHEARLRLERAELARLRGDEVARRELLREAQRLFTEMGAAGHAARIAEELAGRGGGTSGIPDGTTPT
jgi:adenylate cyclase